MYLSVVGGDIEGEIFDPFLSFFFMAANWLANPPLPSSSSLSDNCEGEGGAGGGA